MREPSSALVGQVVEERYLVEAAIGRGAMGTVYRARHLKVGREVAIKVLHAHLVSDPTMVARFEREAALAARLAHRNVVSVLDVGETDDGQMVMMLELARGEALSAIIARGPLERARVINLTTQILNGLDHAHGAGLVHRDLKPENVIVEHDDHGEELPRIVDFGIAVLRDHDAAEQRLTMTGTVVGTPPYMAPEQAHGDAPDSRTDLFALGVMVYEMLAGRQPFDGSGVEVILANVNQDPPAIAQRAPGREVDPLLEAFARKLMARRLRDRFASAERALEVLALIERDRRAAAAALDLTTRHRGAWPMLTAPPSIETPASSAPTMALPAVPAPAVVVGPPAPHRLRWPAALGVVALGMLLGWCVLA